MTKFPCRCRRCGTRKTLAKHPEEYRIPRRCPSCGEANWRVDRYRRLKEHKKAKCLCEGYWFPHRKGSLWCYHYPGEITEQQFVDRYGREWR